jgi:hypothetical protein
MIILGYKEEDITTLIRNLGEAMYDLHGGQSNPYVGEIEKAIDLLEGLLAEGRI